MGKKILVFLMIYLCFFSFPPAQAAIKNQEIIRLHVIANSDSQKDQQLKLKVRDEILHQLNYLNKLTSFPDARKYIEKRLVDLKKEAQEVIVKNGFDYQVDVQLLISDFPTRKYGQKVIPAGEYLALKVIIGKGKGTNWWCVLYPPLCHGDWVKKEEGITRVEDNQDLPVFAGKDIVKKKEKKDFELGQILNLYKKLLKEIWAISKSP